MEKMTLKEVLAKFNPGDTVEIEFSGPKTSLSGEYKVLTSKIGRGKCGSRIATLESSLRPGEVVSIGTPSNDEIVSVTYSGQKYGTGEVSVSTNNRDLDKAKALKEKLLGLVGFGGRQLKLTSATEPSFNGNFTLESAELLKGRYGQIKVNLVNDTTGQTIELWSYRHSGIVDTIEIVE